MPNRRRTRPLVNDSTQGPQAAVAAETSKMNDGSARKSYHQPRLRSYGTVVELTQFGGSLDVDSGGGLGNLS